MNIFSFSFWIGVLWMSGIAAEAKQWGVYQIYWKPKQFEKGLQQQIAVLGSSPTHVLFFRDLHVSRGFPKEVAEICRKHGATPVISQELSIWGDKTDVSDKYLRQIVDGEMDEFWTQWAKESREFGDPIVFRFGFEMNGDWFSWGQQPELFKKAWHRVYQIVKVKNRARNVQFMFSPNIEWSEKKPKTKIALYYPGDEVVDLLGLDGYNFGDHSKKWHRWQEYEEVFEHSLKVMAGSKKPLWIAELGCADDPKKAEWMEKFFQSFLGDDRVEGFIYYNYADGKNDEPNWRLDSDAKTLEVVRKNLKKFGSDR